MTNAISSLPWRGPDGERPDLPLPPGKMPLRSGGRMRKRWRYVGAFADELFVCAARIHVGPLVQSFWVVCDRESGEMWERTRLLLPGARGEVWTEHLGGEEVVAELGDLGVLDYAPDEGSLVRIDADVRGSDDVRAFLRCHGGTWAEAICPTDEGQYVWTRKRADVPIEVDVRVGDRRWRVKARGMEDESAGYHPKHTVWSWSAGVGRTTDGRSVGWNLVSGINDPPERSERAIWVGGKPFEPGPVEFEDLEAIAFDDGSRLRFAKEFERSKEENRLIVKYTYRQPFGTFTGTLPGGLELESGLGVMEFHDATW
ncbi:MAG: DUF2804 domain-containing protein [Solirubrobacterales bacterium]